MSADPWSSWPSVRRGNDTPAEEQEEYDGDAEDEWNRDDAAAQDYWDRVSYGEGSEW